jgi:hypothetical protein
VGRCADGLEEAGRLADDPQRALVDLTLAGRPPAQVERQELVQELADGVQRLGRRRAIRKSGGQPGTPLGQGRRKRQRRRGWQIGHAVLQSPRGTVHATANHKT